MHQTTMLAFCILVFITFSHFDFADQYVNNCPLRLSDYLITNNVDYQPTTSLVMVSQLTVGSVVACGLECLANPYCLTAAFKVNTGQCTLYFEQTTVGHLNPSSDGYLLNANGKVPALPQLIPLLSPSDSIFSIWNSGAGLPSCPSTQGTGYGQYPSSQSAVVAIDRMVSTTYVNYDNTSQWVNSTKGGIGSGFYVLTNLADSSVLTQFRFSTGQGRPERDPLAITTEGSNGGNLTLGSSWTLIYNGSTGLDTDPGRWTFGPLRWVSNAQSFKYYRLLVVAKRNPVDCVQYSEIEFYVFLTNTW